MPARPDHNPPTRGLQGETAHVGSSQPDGHETLPDVIADEDEARPRSGEWGAQIRCPRIEELWPAAVDERPAESVARHLEGCVGCQNRIDRLRREIGHARSLVGDARSTGDAARHAARQSTGAGSAAAHSIADEPPPPDVLSAAPTRPLAVIGKYFVLETISESGQATLFRGLHPALLIDVVIKLAHRPWKQAVAAASSRGGAEMPTAGSHRDDVGGRAHFVSEAKALAEIDHPHLARLYDLDFYEDRPYLVLEYVRGKHLGHYRETADLDAIGIARLVAKVARAVGAAHERGVLHLDLKPENILITRAGEPVLIDFGLSFLAVTSGHRATGDRWVAGTLQYMAPEQLGGDRSALSQRTDVFGLGGVLYFLCVGHDPFVVREIDGRWHRPAEPDWRSLARARVPARLKTICRKALAMDPISRYTSADLLAETLEAAARRWTRASKTRWWKLAGGLVLLGILCWWVMADILSKL